MAAITSLGVHTPVALPYLVAEGILPKDPASNLYRWDTYLTKDGADDVEEEILATRNAVVWSQGKFIRNVYRFNLESEDVIQAILTTFSESSRTKHADSQGLDAGFNSGRKGFGVHHSSSHARPSKADTWNSNSAQRALVVILRSKAHIYFLRGSAHIVELPFEVEKAFTAPRGLILQRKTSLAASDPRTPQIPAAPPNSFWSSQGLPASSLRHSMSPTLMKSFARNSRPGKQPSQLDPLSSNPKLGELFQDIVLSSDRRDDNDVTNLYSLSSPFSDLGVLTYSLQHQKPRLGAKSPAGLSVQFEGLDPAERIVYVTAQDELNRSLNESSGPLMLLVTFNLELSIITIWHAWYIEERSLKTLLKIRAEQKEAKARRRSSFLSANIGTGATTPAVRRRDGTRESIVGHGQLQGEANVAQSTNPTRKPTQQEEEEALASQMDPDYIPTTSQQPVRENRRISSMNTDVRASQNTINASFGGVGGRRTTSFGGTHGRKSLSHRRSHGSTPGSVNGNSMAGDDDTMDLETTIEFDADESVDDILQHMRATFEASGTDSVFGNIEEGFKREIVVRKIHSFPMGLTNSAEIPQSELSMPYKAVTITDPLTVGGSRDQKVKVMVHDRHRGELQCVSLLVKQRSLLPGRRDAPTVAIPLLRFESSTDRCEDILKVRDGHVKGVILKARGIQFGLDEDSLCSLPAQPPYRFFPQHDLFPEYGQSETSVGKNRILSAPSGSICLDHTGLGASFDELASDKIHHRRKLRIRAEHPEIERLLTICEIMLPTPKARILRKVWCMSLAWTFDHPGKLRGTTYDHEMVALTSAVCLMVLELIDSKARAALNIAKVATRDSDLESTLRLRKTADENSLRSSSAWSWMPSQRPVSSRRSPKVDEHNRDQLLVISAAIADELSAVMDLSSTSSATLSAAKIMLAFHVFREEQKLCTLSYRGRKSFNLAPIIAQLGLWLGLEAWSPGTGCYLELEGASERHCAFVQSRNSTQPRLPYFTVPTGVFEWLENTIKHGGSERFPGLSLIVQIGAESGTMSRDELGTLNLTPRIEALSGMLTATNGLASEPSRIVELLAEHKISRAMLETFPESVAAPFREAISRCEKDPPTSWNRALLELSGRDDLDNNTRRRAGSSLHAPQQFQSTTRDLQTVCHALELPILQAKTKEAGRHAVSQLIFSEDRRLVEATNLMHFNSVQSVQCPKQPEWDDAEHLQQMRKAVHWATIRMIALPTGDAMIHFDCQTPLLTERYHLPGFSSSCSVQPMNYSMAPERTGLTEEKVNWAYFHAGVSAGLRISHNIEGIDTSWIAFNKPSELQNRHAGLLFALGLGGHLRRVAKWLLFKYLTPKHTMTSVGLLLGLSASYIGTSDGLVTRMLSVHITRMLPVGAAELNVTPATQAAGMMGIGLVYFNTQHRRMSEVMLSEIEYMEVEDPDSGPDPLRDESYRLSTGFGLGLINIGKGNDLRGLSGMNLAERLLAVAVGPRPVSAVHVFDRATAGAVIAVTLIYMKTGDKTVARKIDIPDTEAQFDQVRPDILMLRAMANHIILWDHIEAAGLVNGNPGWIHANLPECYKNRPRQVMEQMLSKRTIDSAHIPLFNVFTGLAWALALKHAGTGNERARDEILELLKFFYNLSIGADAFYFDGKLGRSALRRCMDALALCAAMVMAGTGDLETFRYLRRMHGRADPETPYGSHLAAHMAIGVLFLGGGTFTFGTSNMAIAALICAFYPLFPIDVQDNRVHLQAFRHLWVLAAEARCLIVEDIDTQRPIQMPILVTLKDGTQKVMQAPCLLPELEKVALVQTNNPAYWSVKLDFVGSPTRLAAFRQDQRIYVRRCPVAEAHTSVFSAALAALNDTQTSHAASQIWYTLFHLDAFRDLDRADIELLLPPDINSSVYMDNKSTVVDDRLTLNKACSRSIRNELWNLRMLFAWAERARKEGDGKLRWIGDEIIESLKARIEERGREMA